MTDGNTDDCEKLLPGNMSDAVSSSLQQQIFFQSRQGRPTTKSKVSHDLRANTQTYRQQTIGQFKMWARKPYDTNRKIWIKCSKHIKKTWYQVVEVHEVENHYL